MVKKGSGKSVSSKEWPTMSKATDGSNKIRTDNKYQF